MRVACEQSHETWAGKELHTTNINLNLDSQVATVVVRHLAANKNTGLTKVRIDNIHYITFLQVGTAFTAFRYQDSSCYRAPGTCLTGQIKDLIDSDAQRVSTGKTPRYLLTRYTYGSDSTVR